jgi:hypothetical protein
MRAEVQYRDVAVRVPPAWIGRRSIRLQITTGRPGPASKISGSGLWTMTATPSSLQPRATELPITLSAGWGFPVLPSRFPVTEGRVMARDGMSIIRPERRRDLIQSSYFFLYLPNHPASRHCLEDKAPAISSIKMYPLTSPTVPSGTAFRDKSSRILSASREAAAVHLFDHLIRPRQQRRRDREAEGLGGL